MRRARRDITSNFSHIIVQGIEKQYIFEKEIYKKKYLSLIYENLEKYEVKLLAYVIMDNHVHMCLHYPKVENLSKFMHLINSKFASYYNYLEKRVGYLFRSRFNSQEIQNRQQLFNVIAYIHNNPIKAKIVNNLREYKYSSYKEFDDGKMDKEKILLIFDTLDYRNTFRFIHKNFNDIDIKDVEDERNKTFEDVVEEYVNANKISLPIIKKEKNLLIYLVAKLKSETKLTNKEISERLEIDKNRLTRMCKIISEMR